MVSSSSSSQLKPIIKNLDSWEGRHINELLNNMPPFYFYTTYYNGKKMYRWYTKYLEKSTDCIDNNVDDIKESECPDVAYICNLDAFLEPNGIINLLKFEDIDQCVTVYSNIQFPAPPN